MAYSNCCGRCTDSYESCSGFEQRDRGIQFFKFFLNGVNYQGSYPILTVFVSYSDFDFLIDNWEAECDIIRRWCAVIDVRGYTVEKPKTEEECIAVKFARPVILEDDFFDDEDDFGGFDGEDDDEYIDFEAEYEEVENNDGDMDV